MKKIPFDFKTSLDFENWQQDFKAVLSEKEIEEFFSKQWADIIDYISQLEYGKKKNLCLLSLPYIMARFNGVLLATKALEQAKEVDFISISPEINFLKTGDKKYLKQKTKQLLTEKPLKTYPLRRIVRTLTWAKWWQLPMTIFNPDIIAVGHNSVLVEKAKQSNKRIYFYQSSELVRKIKAKYKIVTEQDFIVEVNNEIYNLLLGDLSIREPYKIRFKLLMQDFINKYIIDNFHTLEACYQYKKLPKNIWIGTGGGYSFRLLSLAVCYMGGRTVGFSHSTTPVMSPSKETVLLNELAVVSEFVCITPKAQTIIENIRTKHIAPKISHINGEPYFKEKINFTKKPITNKIPTVIYISTTIYDLNKNDIFANAMIYLDWQLRLTDMLDTMNINLICQPHPEGVFVDKKLIHPLRKKYNTPKRNFEEIMQEADIFLIDCIYSTTVGKMLVSNKPVVRISLVDKSNYYGVRDDNIAMIDKRCRTIKAEFGENNLPVVDKQQLEVALTHNWQEKVDATEFRELLIG